MDWLDLLAVQGTLKSLLQHHRSKASIFQCSAFFIVQLSHPYMTTGKTIALTRQTFVGKVMSLHKLKQSVHEQFSHRHVRRLDGFKGSGTHRRIQSKVLRWMLYRVSLTGCFGALGDFPRDLLWL